MFVLMGLCWCACHTRRDKVPSDVPSDADSTLLEVIDSLAMADSLAEVAAIPRNADELFDDFIYNYAGNERLQKRRTVFPLPCLIDGKLQFIEKKDWEHDSLFTNEAYYTLFYQHEEDMDLEKDISLDSVSVEWIYLADNEIRKYNFFREQGLWKLTDIVQESTQEKPYDDFLRFFYQFANDSAFQSNHVATSLKFVSPDPDDEFEVLESVIDRDQWFAFRPLLPTARMTNIDYGQSYRADARRAIIDLRGIGNGFNNTLYFNKVGDSWRLVQFDDLSN